MATEDHQPIKCQNTQEKQIALAPPVKWLLGVVHFRQWTGGCLPVSQGGPSSKIYLCIYLYVNMCNVMTQRRVMT